MKNILKITICFFCFLMIGSCETDRDPVPSANGFELRASTLVSTVVLSPATDDEVIADLNWDTSDNGFSSISTYKVEIAASGTNFANVATANSGDIVTVTTAERNYVLKAGELNFLINQLPEYQCGQAMNIDIRIKSILGGTKPNAFVQYSTNVISIVATPYSTALPLVAFATSASNLESAFKLASSSISNLDDFEGYMYLEVGSYKFYKADVCNQFTTPTVYGLNGANTGSLVLDGSDGFQVTAPGFYLVKANVTAGTYSISKFTTTGIFGAATGLSSFINTPMTYDATDKKFKLTFNLLKAKKFKFKLLNGNVAASPLVVLGGTPNNCVENGADITVAGAATDVPDTQKYDIVLDLNNPRKYTYTLTINPN